MFRRMGELLVEAGELSADELRDIIEEQQRVYRPFGRIAASRFQVTEAAIWRAWAAQYACYCPRVDINREERDVTVQPFLSASEAMQRLMLPLRYHDGDLVVVTADAALSAALQYVDRQTSGADAVVLWLADDAHALVEAIGRAYGLPAAEVRLRQKELRSAESAPDSGPASPPSEPEAA
ncbi:MAG: hypothetical protein ACOC0P_06340 [Planctomycetota bacterium]